MYFTLSTRWAVYGYSENSCSGIDRELSSQTVGAPLFQSQTGPLARFPTIDVASMYVNEDRPLRSCLRTTPRLLTSQSVLSFLSCTELLKLFQCSD